MRPLLIIAIASILGLSCKTKSTQPTKSVLVANVYYTCSMDPQVVEHKPGKCPICKMELSPVQESKTNQSGEIQLSEQQIQLGNIYSDTIRNGSIGDQWVLTATVNFDQSKASSVSARIMGRIEKLYFKNIGDYIQMGAPLFELYSEELNNAKQEYLLALNRKKSFADETFIDFSQLIRSAKNKLLLWGMTAAQIQDLSKGAIVSPRTVIYSTSAGYLTSIDTKEGEYVMVGSTIVKLADLSTLWVEAQVYTAQMAEISQHSIATIQFPDMGGKEIKGNIEFVNPEINPDTRINLIRVSIPNGNGYLKPGMSAYVILNSPKRKTLTLPVNAVIRDGNGAIVWVETAPKIFKSRMVQIGIETSDRIEIIAGLQEGEVVVLSGAYLLQSEYIFKRGVNPMQGHDMQKM